MAPLGSFLRLIQVLHQVGRALFLLAHSLLSIYKHSAQQELIHQISGMVYCVVEMVGGGGGGGGSYIY